MVSVFTLLYMDKLILLAAHSFLHRDSSQADISGFKRRVPPRPSQAAKRRASIPDDARSHSSGSDGSLSYSPPDGFGRHHLGSVEEGKASIFAHGSPMSIDDHKDYIRGQTINRFEMGSYHPGLSASFDRPTSSMVPQSAPAETRSFTLPSQVSQGHLRTRSVQGEPPSATMLSPTSPLAQSAWLPIDAQVAQRYSLEISGAVTQAHNPTDATIWSHRGLTGFSQPASVPNNFAPSQYVPPALQVELPSFTALSVDSAPTISPEFYNPAYSNPGYIPASSRAALIGRDLSLVSSYRPRSISAMNGLDMRKVGDEVRQDEDSALPSASLEAFHAPPFESVIPKG